MNSVALPASATAPALGAEADLIRSAARGDGEAFEELYRRHGQVAWRLGQAVGADQEAAVKAVAEGFGRALRGLRRRSHSDAESFRPLLLAAVYRAALDNLHAHGAPAPTAPVSRAARGGKAKNPDAAFVEAAFRSLPERWRAAVWLSEVEALSEDRVAPILGVSAAVATQLVTRGRRALLGRFEQAHRTAPDHLDSALRPLGATIPTALGASVGERWAALVNDPAARFAPLSAWMSERAVRPLWVSVGGLMGLALIGLGIVGQNTGVNTGPVANGALSGANAPGINPFAHSGTGLPGSGLLNFAANLQSSSGGTGGGGTFSGGSTSPGGSGGGGSGGGGGGGGGQNPPPGGLLNITPPPLTPPPVTSPTNLLPSNPLASATSSGGTTTVTVLPTGTTASVCTSSGVGLSVDGTSLGCPSTSTSSSPTTTSPTTTSSSSLTTTVSNTLSTITGGL